MKSTHAWKKAAALGAALLLAAAMPLSSIAMAEGGSWMGGAMFIDESRLSQDQLAAYQQAKADYEAIEDQQLVNLVGAGVITQSEMDEYQQQRGQPREIPSGQRNMNDGVQLTDAQREALMAAMQSDNREQAIANLVAQGVLSQEQVDAMSQIPQGMPDGQMGGQSGGSLWGKVQQASGTNTAAQIAVNNIQVATANMQQALTNAGIQMGQP